MRDRATPADVERRAEWLPSESQEESWFESSPSIARSPNTIRGDFCEFSSNTPVLTLTICWGQRPSGSSVLRNAVDFLDNTGLHVENKAAHRNFFGDPRM